MPSRGRIVYDMVGVGSLLGQREYRVPVYQESVETGSGALDHSKADVDSFSGCCRGRIGRGCDRRVRGARDACPALANSEAGEGLMSIKTPCKLDSYQVYEDGKWRRRSSQQN
jgi:hypothetical protein